MKRIFSVVLTVALLCSTLLPVAFAENTAVSVAPAGDTLIELEKYYPEAIVEENSNASGGFLVKAANVRPFTGEDERTGDDLRFVPVVRTIILDVAVAGTYKIEWVANERFNPDSSAMTLAVNEQDVFKVIAEGQHLGSNPEYQYKMFTQDGRAQTAALEDASTGENAGYTVAVLNDPVTCDYVMKKYTADVNLTQGANTIDIYVTGGVQYAFYNFVMDYVKISSSMPGIAGEGATRIELDDKYYKHGAARGWDTSSVVPSDLASGGSYIWIENPPTGWGTNSLKERTFSFYAYEAGNYDVTFVAGPNSHGEYKSKVELLINDTEIIDSAETANTDPTPGVDLPTADLDMKLYKAENVTLNEGVNTFTIKVTGDTHYAVPYFALDYLEFAPAVEEDTRVAVSSIGSTTIELDAYYPEIVKADTNASGSSLVRASDSKPFAENVGQTAGDQRRFTPIKRTITLNVETAGNYGIEWVANTRFNEDSSAMTLAVNDKDVFKVIAQGAPAGGAYAGQTIAVDGRGQVVDSLSGATSGTDAGYTVSVNDRDYVMKKYTATVALDEGDNTIDLYLICGLQWGNYNFCMDYVKLTSSMKSVSSTKSATIELEEYYPSSMYLANGSASGGGVACINDIQPDFIKVEGSEDYRNGSATENGGDQRRFKPIARTITFNAEEAGNYTIEWIANKNVNADSSPITLAVNDKDVFRVISNGGINASSSSAYAGQTLSRDGRGNIVDDSVFLNEQSPSVDAGWALTIAGVEYKMQKYTATVALDEGINTISVYFCGGVNYTNYNLAMDCVTLSYSGEIEEKVDSATIDTEAKTATATVYYDTTYTGKVILAVYDANNRFIGMNSADISADYATISASYTGTAASVKVFVWNNFEACKPLAAAKIPTIQ